MALIAQTVICATRKSYGGIRRSSKACHGGLAGACRGTSFKSNCQGNDLTNLYKHLLQVVVHPIAMTALVVSAKTSRAREKREAERKAKAAAAEEAAKEEARAAAANFFKPRKKKKPASAKSEIIEID